jgi:hypothetical protein
MGLGSISRRSDAWLACVGRFHCLARPQSRHAALFGSIHGQLPVRDGVVSRGSTFKGWRSRGDQRHRFFMASHLLVAGIRRARRDSRMLPSLIGRPPEARFLSQCVRAIHWYV